MFQDRITPTRLQQRNHNAIAHLTSLLNRISQSFSFPTTWKTTLIPLLKPLKNPTLPSPYRPIFLFDTLDLILEKTLNNRLTWFLHSNEWPNQSQFGCRRRRSALNDTQFTQSTPCRLYMVFEETKFII